MGANFARHVGWHGECYAGARAHRAFHLVIEGVCEAAGENYQPG